MNALRLAQMYLRELGCLGSGGSFTSTGVTVLNSSCMLSERVPGLLEQEGETIAGPKFGLSSIVGPHIWSNTHNYGIHCVPAYGQRGGITSSYGASAEFLPEEWMSLLQSAAGSSSSMRDLLAAALPEFTAGTRVLSGSLSPQSAWGSEEEGVAGYDDGSSGLPISSVLGEKFVDGQKGPSEGVQVHHELLTTSITELGVTVSRHVRAKTSGEREIFTARLINRDYYADIPSLTFGSEELMEKSKHDGLSNGSSSHSESSPQDLDTLRFPEIVPTQYCKWQGDREDSGHREGKIVGGRKASPRSAPMAVPKRPTTLSDDDAALCKEERISYAFSMKEGVGRTLKGRDLIQFRNHVLRLTGFIAD